MKRGLLILTFVSVIVLGALHQAGSAFYLYWDVVWFDVLMHFLGGFAVSLIFVWAWYGSDMFGRRNIPNQFAAILAAVAFVMFVGVAWEVFEYAFDIANPMGGNYSADTLHDFVADIVGGIVAAFIGTRKFFHE